MNYSIQKRVLLALSKSGKSGLRTKELAARIKLKPADAKRFAAVLESMAKQGEVVRQGDRYKSPKALGLFAASVTRIQKTFGFAKRIADEVEVFIPGKFLKGALPDDLVFVRLLRNQRGSSPEGEVVSIVSYGPGEFTGVVTVEGGKYMVLPDQFTRLPIDLVRGTDAAPGQKVIAKVVKRGRSHAEHRARIIASFGDAGNASACAAAVLQMEGVTQAFPSAVQDEARYLAHRGIREQELTGRLDLRGLPIFTIDGADSKDLDDAISLSKEEDGSYRLGVHIADVSHYVRVGSALDKEAYERGTSIYYANQVVPMLPKELSNGICSLNPNEDRLSFSAMMTLDAHANLMDFEFHKSVIRSRVKGIYTEVNAFLDGTAGEAVAAKYSGLTGELALMKELAEKRMENRKRRGAPELETTESKIVVDENDVAVDVKPRTRGFAERMIEEFMLLANEAAATLAKQERIPFVYRVHENPTDEKLETLSEALRLLGLNARGVQRGIRPGRMAQILEDAKGTPVYNIVNMQMLRAMAKAKYSEIPVGHYGLALGNYAHFTSPIRRYPDLMIHRILTDFLNSDASAVTRRYRRLAHAVALQSTEAELRAVNIERSCEDCYKAEYMRGHIGESFEGIIDGATSNGFFVELPNTVEGMVRVETLPEGQYEFDGYFELKDKLSGRSYRVGSPVRVVCTKVDVNAGRIDFELEKPGFVQEESETGESIV